MRTEGRLNSQDVTPEPGPVVAASDRTSGQGPPPAPEAGPGEACLPVPAVALVVPGESTPRTASPRFLFWLRVSSWVSLPGEPGLAFSLPTCPTAFPKLRLQERPA